MVEVTAKDGKDGKSATVLVDLGDSLPDATSRFGDEVIMSNYIANVKITVQSAIRRYIKAGLDDDAIQAKFDNYRPGVTLDRVVDPIAALANKMAKMTAEEREQAFAALKAKLGG
jgi:hypothetical protein